MIDYLTKDFLCDVCNGLCTYTGYGYIVLRSNHGARYTNDQTYEGLTMSEYCEKYEQSRHQKIEAKYRELLKRLTPSVLFCKFCHRPFTEDDIEYELTTPYMALLDYISALVFVSSIVVWLALILLIGVLAIVEIVWIICRAPKKRRDTYKPSDFDKEYFSGQFDNWVQSSHRS